MHFSAAAVVLIFLRSLAIVNCLLFFFSLGVQLIGHEDVFMSSLIDQQDNFNGNQMGVGGNEYSNLQSLSGLMALSHQSGPVTQVLGVLMDNQSNVPPDLQDCDPDPTLSWGV